jgi:hypothetical protein
MKKTLLTLVFPLLLLAASFAWGGNPAPQMPCDNCPKQEMAAPMKCEKCVKLNQGAAKGQPVTKCEECMKKAAAKAAMKDCENCDKMKQPAPKPCCDKKMPQ